MDTLSKTAPAPHLWYKSLPEACFAHNATVSAATGETPFSLMHGRPPRSLIHLDSTHGSQIKSAADSSISAQQKIANVLDNLKRHNNAMILPYKIGEIVLLHDPVLPRGPGSKRMHLPYSKHRRIVAIDLPNTLSLVPHPEGGAIEKVNMNRVKRAPDVLQVSPEPVAKPRYPVPAMLRPQAPTPNLFAKAPAAATVTPSKVVNKPLATQAPVTASEPPAKRPLRSSLSSANRTPTPTPPATPRAPSTTTKSGRQVYGKVRFE
jgi:hypothetical protein